MSKFLCVTFRFLDPSPCFHGNRDDDEPEWPPSPLRLFQALVNASANRWRNAQFEEYAVKALNWHQELNAPEIFAPVHQVGTPFRIAVPNNDLDSPASVWAKGKEPEKPHRPIDLKTMKQVRPTHLLGNTLHYVYVLPAGESPHLEVLRSAARSVTHLGWGIDMVAGDAAVMSEKEVAKLRGEVWRPAADSSGVPLRVPIEGTLDALIDKHKKFLNRLSDGGFKPVPPLSAFRVVHYRRATDSAASPYAAFSILKPDASGHRAFDTARRARDVAAWVRHATGFACASWPDVATFVHGHDADDSNKPARGDSAKQRFMYLPLPTINPALNRVEAIRRALIVAPPGCRDRIDFVQRRLSCQDLTSPDGEVRGLLNILPTNDWVLRQYTATSTEWSTVTPVVWPGYDDRDAEKAEVLLRKAFVHAGLSPELVKGCELEWRQVGFRAGLDLAKNYQRPDHLTGCMYHVRVRFAHPVPGPLAVGAGRYRGFGLFAAEG